MSLVFDQTYSFSELTTSLGFARGLSCALSLVFDHIFIFWNLQQILQALLMVQVVLCVPGFGKLYQTYLFLYLAMDFRICCNIQNKKAQSDYPRLYTYGAASIKFSLCWKFAILCLFITEVRNYQTINVMCLSFDLCFIYSTSHLIRVSFVPHLIYSVSHLFCISFIQCLICLAFHSFYVLFVLHLIFVLRLICFAFHIYSASYFVCISFVLYLIFSASHLFYVSFVLRLICSASHLFCFSFVLRPTNKNMQIERASHPLFSIKSLIQIGFTIYPIHC